MEISNTTIAVLSLALFLCGFVVGIKLKGLLYKLEESDDNEDNPNNIENGKSEMDYSR